MAKFSQKDIFFKDDDMAVFGTGQDSELFWDGTLNDLRLTTTISGVDPIQDYHLTTKYYVDQNRVDNFLGLTDTPSTYSGANGYYLRVTESGTLSVEFSNDVNKYVSGAVLYPNAQASDVGGYNEISIYPASGVEQHPTVNTSTSAVIEEFITNALDYDIFIPAGKWVFNIYADTSNANQHNAVGVEVYERTPGGSETLIFDDEIDLVSTSSTLYNLAAVADGATLESGNRLVFKFLGINYQGGSKTIGIYYQGTTRYTNIDTPISVAFSTDHSKLNNLDSDDHLQYVPTSASRGFTNTVSGVDPTQDYHLTTKSYVDNNFVTLDTNQTISGAKTFMNTTTFSGAVSGIDINELDDVNAPSATNGQVLHYDDGDWVPTTLSGEVTVKAYYDGYDSTGGTDVSAGWTDVPLGTDRQKTIDFSHTLGSPEVTCNKSGSYVIISRVTVYQSAGGSRSAAQMRLTLDTGSGFTEVSGTYGMIYSRNTTQGEGTAEASVILDLESSDALRLQARLESGTGTINLMADSSSLTIFPAIGQKGDKGEKGDPGSGSSIIVKDNGVTISGSPTDTLNFKGFVVDDTVSGTATVERLFGSWYGYTIEDAQSSTSSTAWQQKARFTANGLPAGTYRVSWFYEWGYSNLTRDFQCQVQVDDTTTLASHREEAKDSGTDQQRPGSGFGFVTLTAGNHYVDVDYRASNAGDTARIRNTRIEFWRFS